MGTRFSQPRVRSRYGNRFGTGPVCISLLLTETESRSATFPHAATHPPTCYCCILVWGMLFTWKGMDFGCQSVESAIGRGCVLELYIDLVVEEFVRHQNFRESGFYLVVPCSKLWSRKNLTYLNELICVIVMQS